MRASRVTLAGGVVGALVVVEFTSGVLQGYYTPLLTDIARHLNINDADINWFEAAQLLLSAIVVPFMARLGDMFGHRKILVFSLIVTLIASIGVAFAPTFPIFIASWALQGFYVVWLPMNITIIFLRSRGRPDSAALTRKGAGLIVVALQAGAIIGALAGGQLGTVFEGQLWLTLSVPAVLVAVALGVVLLKVPDTGPRAGGTVDSRGTVILTLALLGITGGLSLVRLNGVTPWVFAVVLIGIGLLWLFVRVEQRRDEPLIDIAMFKRPELWPVFLTSALFGVSVLGAQGPLSTFARTDPDEVGYGLGATSATASYLIGGYVMSLLVGAGVFARVSRSLTPRKVLIGASALVAIGYFALIPFHANFQQVLIGMIIAGLGSGALVAALPAAAAAAAPSHQTGVATGLTNTTKVIGGAFASSAFALALASGAVAMSNGAESTAGSLSGYITVWAICGGTAVIATVFLFAVPKVAFTSPPMADLDGLPAADAGGTLATEGPSREGEG